MKKIITMVTIVVGVLTAEAYRQVFAKALVPDLLGLLVLADVLLIMELFDHDLQIYQRVFLDEV